MACRMKGEINSIDTKRLAIGKCLYVAFKQKTVFDHRHCSNCTQIMLMASVGMIGMTMADNRLVYRFPGIQINIGLFAIDALIGKL